MLNSKKKSLGNMRLLAKTIGIYGLGHFINRLISLLLLPLFTAYISPEEYGIQSMLSFLLLFLTPLVTMGVGTAFGQCYKETESRDVQDATVWSCFTLLLITSSFVCFLGILFSNELSLWIYQTKEHAHFIVLTFLAFVFSVIMTPFTMYLQFEQKASLFVCLSLIASLVNIVINCLLIVRWRMGIEGLVMSTLITNVFQFLCFFIPARRHTRFRVRLSLIRQLCFYGMPMIASFGFMFILQNGWRYFMESNTSLSELGVFTIGFNFGMIGSLIVGAFISAWAPYFLGFMQKQQEAKPLFQKIQTYYYLVAGSLCFTAFALAKVTVLAMTQPAFHGCYDIIGFIAFGFFITGTFNLYLPGVYFARKVYLTNVVQAVATLIFILVAWIGTPLYGKWGVIAAFCLAHFCMGLSQQLLNHVCGFFYAGHDWRLLARYALLFISAVGVTFIPRELTIVQEGMYALGLLILYSILFLAILPNTDINRIKALIYSLLGSRDAIKNT